MRHPLTPTVTAAALALVLALTVGCSATTEPVRPARAAGEQSFELRWVERYPAQGPGLVFRVRSFAVTREGWEAEVAFENSSGIHWELPEEPEAFRRMFGVMLFDTGDLAELDRLNREAALPTVRRADTLVPDLITFVPDGETWSGRITARGTLPAGAFVRLAFGPFSAVTDPPEGMEKRIVWITDHAVQLEP